MTFDLFIALWNDMTAGGWVGSFFFGSALLACVLCFIFRN